MKRLRFYLQPPHDPERVDVVEVVDGAVLIDNQQSSGKWPFITVSQLVRVEFIDDAALRVVDDEGASTTVAPTPSPLPENVLGSHISPGLGVHEHVRDDHSNAQESP